MTENASPGPRGPLASVIAVRGGSPTGHGAAGLEHREALIYALGKAAELEHLIMLQYQFAAFSLKLKLDEGISPERSPRYSAGGGPSWRSASRRCFISRSSRTC